MPSSTILGFSTSTKVNLMVGRDLVEPEATAVAEAARFDGPWSFA
jgi:hypothetical protein